ncbi:MAG: hypothetical protein KIT19_14890 [Phycisphaeraceae bacterium]|nr:hypothetical protein [Phycisphaeraceae bacterium]MCW5769960.1 hypothetical protein [Phycisphaeraceae bacterium]
MNRAAGLAACGVLSAIAAGCGGSAPGAARFTFTEIFPHVRLDREAGVVEFDARVEWDFHHPEEPDTWLEQVICLPDTREHESLAVSAARPSHVHAALLAAGFEPGRPGSWRWDGDRIVPVHPEGERVEVYLVTIGADGREDIRLATDWIEHAPSGERLTERARRYGDGFVFAGSRIVDREGRRWYDADMTGELIGLMSFGGDLIAWSVMLSPDAQVQEPIYRVRPEAAAVVGTPVRVQIRRAGHFSPVR